MIQRFAFAAVATCLAVEGVAEQVCTPAGCFPTAPRSESLVAAPAGSAAIVRIVHRGGRGSSYGSGAIIAHAEGRSFVLTCAHLFDEPGVTRIVSRRGSIDGRVVAIDRVHDLALLSATSVDIAPLRAEAIPLTGQLTACGFGGDGRLRCVRGAVLGSAIAAGAKAPSTLIAGSVRPGDSGGPVIDAAGRVVAVVWGERAGRTYAMGGGPLRRILERLPKPQANPQHPPVTNGDDRLARIEQRLEALAAAATREPTAQGVELDRLGDRLAKSLGVLERRIGDLASRVTDAAKFPVGSVAPSPLVGSSAVRRWGAIALSVGTPAVAGWFAWRVWRRKPARSEIGGGATPIAIDTPPPPQKVAPQTHYVSYDRDDFAKAHQWASEQLARKFPGSVELLTSLDSLIRQQLAGADRSK